jgi:hypothetical protein
MTRLQVTTSIRRRRRVGKYNCNVRVPETSYDRKFPQNATCGRPSWVKYDVGSAGSVKTGGIRPLTATASPPGEQSRRLFQLHQKIIGSVAGGLWSCDPVFSDAVDASRAAHWLKAGSPCGDPSPLQGCSALGDGTRKAQIGFVDEPGATDHQLTADLGMVEGCGRKLMCGRSR